MVRDGKPLELPGFYWDVERHRYFPIASRPKRKVVDEEPAKPEITAIPNGRATKRPSFLIRYAGAFQAGPVTHTQRAQIAHETEGASLISSHTELDPPIRPLSWQSTITSFHAATVDDTLNVVAGDSSGVLHCSRAVIKTGRETRLGPDQFNDNARLFTSYHLGQGAAVSHIVRSGDVAVAVTNTCESCALGVRDLKAPDHSGFSFPRINVAGDIRAASLLNKSLALGISRKIIHVKEICITTKGHNTFQAGSDVLAVTQSSNTITAGLRNGAVRLFDVRARSHASTELLGARFSGKGGVITQRNHGSTMRAHSAITHLQGVREWELLVGTSAGELEMFDLRFATGSSVQPTISFPGHVNSYLLELGITIDPSSSFLFVAGQDRRIRAWSLRTGRPLGSLLGGAQLRTPAKSLAVTQYDDDGRNSKWLWMAQDDEVRVARLGGPRS